MATTTSTTISPSVSSARMSVRIDVDHVVATARPRRRSRELGRTACLADGVAGTPTSATATATIAPARRRRPRGPQAARPSGTRGEAAEADDEADDDDGLDEQLGEHEIGGSVRDEQPGDAEADRAEHQRRAEPRGRPGSPRSPRRRSSRQHRLASVVPPVDRIDRRSADERHGAKRRRARSSSTYSGQRAVLHSAGDLPREPARDRRSIQSTLAAPRATGRRRVAPSKAGAGHQADRDDHDGGEEGVGQAGPAQQRVHLRPSGRW